MQMSAAYMAQTVEHLRSAGFGVTEIDAPKLRDEQLVFQRSRYICCRPPDVDLVLEVITYPDGKETYFLEMRKVGPMRCFSFPLDSWKFRPMAIEFKYGIEPTSGLGLSFVLDLTPR